MRSGFQGYLNAVRNPAFRRFWLGLMVSRCGSAFTVVALSWLVLDLAGPRELGLVLLCAGLPVLVCGPIAGRLLDRFPVRRLLFWDNTTRALLLLTLLGRPGVAHLCVVAALSGALAAVSEVSEGVLVPRLVPDEDLEAANSLLSVNWELAHVLGPPTAGFLIARTGTGTALVADAASFAVMGWLSWRLPDVRATTAPERRPAFATLARFPAAVVLTACATGFLFLSGATDLLYPVYARNVLHDDATAFGVLLGAAGTGGLCGVLFGLPLYLRLPAHTRLPVVIASGAPFLACLPWAGTLWAAAVLVAAASFLWAPFYAVERSSFQRAVPGEARGAVTGARSAVCAVGFPLGSAAGGALFGTSTPAAVVVLAAAYVVLATVPLLGRRALRASPAGHASPTPR
ncbi:MFS transporter [Nocardia sp. NRRL S-836]|uniref:MFS transporter n=1 Tax=Nocardia sp. NRRL S-836 TaxID=1519492 RepID=UPI0006AF08C6|nr:MFS transporter [Nocardia sp. NRRL S-836]